MATRRPFISLTSDFGQACEAVGLMKGVILGIEPDCHLIDLTHGVASFSAIDGAREFETVFWLPVGIHVCVVDFGVGTRRRAILIETQRGDFLIGPDNGVLLPAAIRLGGMVNSWSIENPDYMVHPVSATLHGRDVFAPCAGWLAQGVEPSAFGPSVPLEDLVPAPFDEATFNNEGVAKCQVIHLNKFGTLTLNLRDHEATAAGLEFGHTVKVTFEGGFSGDFPFVTTFGEVALGERLMLVDSYGRLAIAVNQGLAAEEFGVSIGGFLTLQ